MKFWATFEKGEERLVVNFIGGVWGPDTHKLAWHTFATSDLVLSLAGWVLRSIERRD